MMRKRCKRGGERGAVAVEMAMVTPLLVALVFGIIDFSRIFNAELQLSQAAREGARLASITIGGTTPAYSKDQIRARLSAAAPNPAFVGNSAVALDSNIQLCPPGTTWTDPTTGQTIGPVSSVTVTTDFKGILFFSSTKTLTQTAVMICGG
jgi:Flp pilus assembly protein TadG